MTPGIVLALNAEERLRFPEGRGKYLNPKVYFFKFMPI
jgi:hypothetical protein